MTRTHRTRSMVKRLNRACRSMASPYTVAAPAFTRRIIESDSHLCRVSDNRSIKTSRPSQAGVALLAAMVAGACCPVNVQNTCDEIIAELRSFRVDGAILLAHHAATDALKVRILSAGMSVMLLFPDQTVVGLSTLEVSVLHIIVSSLNSRQ